MESVWGSELANPLEPFVCSQFKRLDLAFRGAEGRRAAVDFGGTALSDRGSDSREDSVSSSVDSDGRLFMETKSGGKKRLSTIELER